MANEKMNINTVTAVLNQSKHDLTVDDIAPVIDDEELLEFIEDNEYEMNEFMKVAVPEIMNRLKIRMAFAKSGEENREDE